MFSTRTHSLSLCTCAKGKEKLVRTHCSWHGPEPNIARGSLMESCYPLILAEIFGGGRLSSGLFMNCQVYQSFPSTWQYCSISFNCCCIIIVLKHMLTQNVSVRINYVFVGFTFILDLLCCHGFGKFLSSIAYHPPFTHNTDYRLINAIWFAREVKQNPQIRKCKSLSNAIKWFHFLCFCYFCLSFEVFFFCNPFQV